MATWTYLDAYLSSIPSTQRQNLLNLIYSDVLSQKIQTLAQYESVLNSELTELSTGIPKPAFTLRTATYQSITSSANFNDMERSAIGALQALYKEAVLLEDAISNYNNVIIGHLDSIEATVGSLEKQVDALEILSTNTEGYVTSVYDSFNEQNTFRLNRVDTNSTTPFTIPDLGFIPDSNDAQITDNSLRLPITSNLGFRIGAAFLQNQQPAGSGVTMVPAPPVSSDDIPSQENAFSLASLLDSDPTTYWAQTVDISTLSSTKAEADLILVLAGTQQINNIFLVPFTRFPYKITSIQYTKNIASGVYYELLDNPGLYPITVGTSTSIQFADKYADSLKIHIVQQNYSALRYITAGADNTITQVFDVATGQSVPTAELTDPSTYYFAMTHIMQQLLNIEKSKLTDTNIVDVYEFLYGIKTINISQVQYLHDGIYVTKPYPILLAGAVGLNANESVSDPLTSIEYDLLVEYDDVLVSGNPPEFVSSFAQNILPTATLVVTGEVLDGTDNAFLSNWSAETRFGVTSVSGVQVFQNNILLSPTFYALTQNSTTKKVTVTIANTAISPSQRNISFYTINYTPTKDAYTINLVRHDQAVVNLRILLRSLSPNRMLTPLVRSFSLKFKKFVGN